MELYPILFTPILKEKIWGGKKLKEKLNKTKAGSTCGESWEISGIEGDVSVVKNGFLKGNNLSELLEIYMGDLVGEEIFEKFGTEFPLLFKYIDASELLSIQVHPDDKLAKERHQAYGKTEMWYVLDADKNSEIITGFNTELNKQSYLKAFNNGELEQILNKEKVKKSDAFLIPSGRVHAIGKGILLAEIQQSSDITYRIYDWDRLDKNRNGRELHTDLALDALDFKTYDSYRIDYSPKNNDSSNLIDSPYFTCNILKLDKSIETDYYNLDSFVVYMCVEGEFSVQLDNGTKEFIKTGETVLIPAVANTVTLSPNTSATLLEIFIKPKKTNNDN